jgi:hypothetical protein
MTSKENPMPHAVPAPAPILLAETVNCASWTATRCCGVSAASSISSTGLLDMTSAMTGSGMRCAVKCVLVSRSPAVAVCVPATPLMISMRPPKIIPSTDGMTQHEANDYHWPAHAKCLAFSECALPARATKRVRCRDRWWCRTHTGGLAGGVFQGLTRIRRRFVFKGGHIFV